MGAGPFRNKSGTCFAEPGNTAVSMGSICLRKGISVPAVEFISEAPVPQRTGLFQIQITGMPGLCKIVSNGTCNLLCPAGKPHTGNTDSCMIRNQLCCLIGSDKLCHKNTSSFSKLRYRVNFLTHYIMYTNTCKYRHVKIFAISHFHFIRS